MSDKEKYETALNEFKRVFLKTLPYDDKRQKYIIKNDKLLNLVENKFKILRQNIDELETPSSFPLFEFENFHFIEPIDLSSFVIFYMKQNIEKLKNTKFIFSFKNCDLEKFINTEAIKSFLEHNKADGYTFDKCSLLTLSLDSLSMKSLTINHSKIENFTIFGHTHCNAKISVAYTDIMNISIIDNKTFNQEVEFKHCYFSSVSHCQNLISTCDFKDVEFNNATYFRHCKFYVCPNFLGAKFDLDTAFEFCKFYDYNSVKAETIYRYLKNKMADLGYDIMVHEFHAMEIESRHNKFVYNGTREVPKKEWLKIGDAPEIIGMYILKWLSNYGRDLWRPLIFLLGIFISFFLIYWMFGAIDCVKNETFIERQPQWVSQLCGSNFFLPLYYSGANTVGPLVLFFKTDAVGPVNGWWKLLGFLQFIICTLIWFLWVVQIRRRFKM